MSRLWDRWTPRALVLALIALGLVTAGHVSAAADPALQSGKYSVTVLDDGTTYTFTWTLAVNGGALSGTSYNNEYGFNDPLSGSASTSGATIVRSCGPEASARFTNCGDQTYVLTAGAGGVLTGTGTGFGVVDGTTISMHLASGTPTTTPPPIATPKVPKTTEPTVRMQSIKPLDPTKPTHVTVERDGKIFSVSENVTLQTGDIIKTDPNTILAFEFLIGGRVGVNANTEVKLTGERSIEGVNVSAKTHALKIWDLWVSNTSARALRTPIEIQTNGGTMGIKG
jgi:hypothetical protein